MPKIPGVPFGSQTTLADLSAFNPIANQYALAGFTVGEILAMPEFADFAQSQAEQTGGTATSAGLANLEAQLRETGSKGPEDRPEGFGPKTNFEPTSMKFLDGKLVYDKINPVIDQKLLGIAEDQPVPGIPSLFSALKTFGTSIFDKVTDPFTKYREKKAQEEREAKIAEEKKAALALQQKIKQEFADREQKQKEKEAKALSDANKKLSDDIKKTFEEREAKKAAKAKAAALAEQKKNIEEAKQRKKEREGGKGNPGAGGGGGLGCFVKGTMVEMADGTEKEITSITVGEKTKGGVVEAKLEFMPTQIYNYKDVEVSGSHLVMENNQFVKVEDSEISVVTDKVEPVYCFETSDNRIWVKGIEFGDYLTGSHDQWQPHIDSMLETINQELNGHI